MQSNYQNFSSMSSYFDKTITGYEDSKIKEIGSYVFYNCADLTTISFPSVTIIGSSAFQYCSKLTSLYLLGSQVATLTNINAFGSTPISNYTTETGGAYGSIFVPASLYDSYKTASKWSTYSSRLVSM